MNELIDPRNANYGSRALTAANVREHVNLIQEVMQAVMKKDTHYGVIPGCKQPSLYKAGSEVLLTTFRIAVSVRVEDLSTPDCIRYRVYTTGTHQQTGIVIGEGVGECSTDEDKYKWRRCFNKKEFDAAPETRRRIKFSKFGEDMQIRTEPADLANTVLKMAKKRAQIDLTLTGTAASDIFTQDIEDIPDELRDHMHEESRAAARPGSQAVQRTVPEDTPERLALIEELKGIAKSGTEVFRSAWEKIGKDKRNLVKDQIDAFRLIATAADADIADAAEVTP